MNTLDLAIAEFSNRASGKPEERVTPAVSVSTIAPAAGVAASSFNLNACLLAPDGFSVNAWEGEA